MRAVGIEPTLLSEPDFESGASTSSTTPAYGCFIDEASALSKLGLLEPASVAGGAAAR